MFSIGSLDLVPDLAFLGIGQQARLALVAHRNGDFQRNLDPVVHADRREFHVFSVAQLFAVWAVVNHCGQRPSETTFRIS